MTFLSTLWSKVFQLLTTFAFLLWGLLQVRKGIREDAIEDTTREMEELDAQYAEDLRYRIDAAPNIVRLNPTDDRGYRD